MNLITIGLIAAASALLACGSSAEASVSAAPSHSPSIIAAPLAAVVPASLAWSGEDESLHAVDMGDFRIAADELNVEMMTAVVAPEPPAIVLAGMALGGVLCGRSILRKRRVTKSSSEHDA